MNSRLCSSSSKLHISSSFSSLLILTCQYILWIKASQPITYPELQAKLPSSSSHKSGVTMTCWCQSSVIYPMTREGALSSSSQQPWPVRMKRWAFVIRRGWRLHKGGANSVASNRPLRLHAIQWCLRNDNLISSISGQSTDSFDSQNYLPTA